MSAGRAGMRKVVRGFVVKVETREQGKNGVVMKERREVSRVYQSRDAAVELMHLFQQQNPERDYYVHEKGGHDDAEIY